jgi:hypothetical protein
MITFSRTMLVGAEIAEQGYVRFQGVLEDRIYAMEIRMDVRANDGVITGIEGRMKRYTTPVCPKATDALQNAIGISVREAGWISRINREVGRKGCQHFAEILVECGRCLDSALLANEMAGTLENDPGGDLADVSRSWVHAHPEAAGKCLARPIKE